MPNKRTADYWKKRFEALENASNTYGQQTFRQIEPAFDKAQREIEKEIESWYGRFAKNNNITMQEARKLLSTKELKEFRWDVKEYIKYGRENDLTQAWMKELENASARVHISRLEALKIRTQHAAEIAFGNELDCIDAMARKVFTEDYYHTIYEVQKGFGIGWEIGQIDTRKLETLVSKPWAADGKNFSQRIWGQRDQLVNELHTQLTRTCILGKAPDDAINAIAKKFNTTKNQAGRLVMTEQAYFHSVAQQDAFNDLDVEEFEVVATLDSSTSEICQEMDGKHFPMKDYQPGVTAPPFHVWCRSVTVPWFEDNYTGERAARDEDGNTYYVPDSMTYEKWKRSMVDGDTDGLEVIDDVENIKKMISDKEVEIENITHKIDEVNVERKDYQDGLSKYKTYDDMSDSDFEKYVGDLKKKEADLTTELDKIKVDMDKYYDRPPRRSPEREEWNKWVSDNNIDIDDLNERFYPMEDERLKIKDELRRISEYEDFKSKFNGKSIDWYENQVSTLTDSKNTLKSEIEDLKKRMVEALKNRSVGDSFEEKIQNLKDIISAKGEISEDDLQEAGKLFKERLLNDKRYKERNQKIDDLTKQKDSAYKKYKDVSDELYDFKKRNPVFADEVERYESLEWWVQHRPDHKKFAEDFKAAGEKIKQMKPDYFDIKKQIDGLYDEYTKVSAKLTDLKSNFEYDNAEDVKRILSQVREMGSDGIDIKGHLCNSKSAVGKYVEQAYSYYPTDWVKASVNHGTMKPKKVQRGYYGGSEIAISGDGVDAFSTSLHELGHRMEDIVPEIKKAEKAFYARRTDGEDLKWLGSPYRRDEKTRKDDFLHPYMGKDYGGSFYELVSMGFEYGYTNPAHLMKDPDMATWIYGILTLH